MSDVYVGLLLLSINRNPNDAGLSMHGHARKFADIFHSIDTCWAIILSLGMQKPNLIDLII